MKNTPFKNVRHAISYYNHSKPGRYKGPDFGRERTITSVKDLDFTGTGANDLWCSISGAIGRTLRRYSTDQVMAWTNRNFGDKSEQLSIEQLAEKFSVGEQKIRRWLKNIDVDLIRELRRRELIPKAQTLSKLDFIAGWDARKEVELEMEEASQGKEPEETLILITDIDLERAWQRYQERQKEMMGE